MKRKIVACPVAASLGSALVMLAALTLTACGAGEEEPGGYGEDDGFAWEVDDLATAEQALFDTSTIDATAKQALLAAGVVTVASQWDPLGIGAQVEFCGLVVKKANGSYRAGAPTTQNRELSCSASIALAAGEKIVGYYHTHTPASVTGFSAADKTAANTSGRQYYVISTVNACAKRYNPSTKATTSLGCFPGSF